MNTYARIHNDIVAELFSTDDNIAEIFNPSLTWVDVTSISPQPQQDWTYDGTNFAAPVEPTLTLAQQAQSALAAGLVITSTATPSLNGTYALDPTSRANLTSLYAMIGKANGAFPMQLTALPYPDIEGAVHIFNNVQDFLNFEEAISNYALQLLLIVTTGNGTLPAPTATIA